MTRRNFLEGALATTLMSGCVSSVPATASAPAGGKMLFGAKLGSLKEVQLMKCIGYDFWEWPVFGALDPKKDDEWWKRHRDELASYPLPLRSCNGFIPGEFRLTGPKADFEPALAYAETALRRADELGVQFVVFGSGGARNVPGDFCGPIKPDVELGARQYADFCRILTKRVADLKTVQIVIEPLCPNESNIINYVWQGLEICNEVNSPRLGQLADLFHMMTGHDDPRVLTTKDAVRWLRHVHIAEYKTRQFPGHDPSLTEHFRPYFQALKDYCRQCPEGRTIGVSCECGFGKNAEIAKNLETSLKTMKELA